ncbi:MAG: hypothetical protein PHO07_16985 [Pirellulales bacterium]|jgi:hypothetical protein|nr:hypothetical protein [Thermoguttaceae bacterium]MDD4788868.1 hypothetical protein [Pirellulales bacterium]MDI9442613.1 hypothetical protein [Planctomycetota bacterium]NLZ03099.1 hypothetical protein [Pirellulaceae bacterium]
MPRETMRRQASDNEYLHPDFHGALSVGIEYLHEKYGEQAVRQYLWQFARTFYAPLTEALNTRGLAALAEHFRTVYALEGGAARFSLSEDELRIEVDACPAVKHMRQQGYPVARLYRATTETVNRAICHETPFAAELVEYDELTGRGIQRFFRRTTEGEFP